MKVTAPDTKPLLASIPVGVGFKVVSIFFAAWYYAELGPLQTQITEFPTGGE